MRNLKGQSIKNIKNNNHPQSHSEYMKRENRRVNVRDDKFKNFADRNMRRLCKRRENLQKRIKFNG